MFFNPILHFTKKPMKKFLLPSGPIFHFLALLIIASAFSSCTKKDNAPAETFLSSREYMDVAYGSDTAQRYDLYLPAGRSADSTITLVMIHGGAWAEGDKSDFNGFVPVVRQRFPGYAIANINYRLARPGINLFPTQENDLRVVLQQLQQKAKDYGISQKFVLLGASAGGQMALLQAYKYDSPKILAVVDYFGPADMKELYQQSTSQMTQWGLQTLLNGTPLTNPVMYAASSPVNFIDANDPPTIIFHGTNDVVVPIAQSQALKLRLQNNNVISSLNVYQGLGHDIWPEPAMLDSYMKLEAFLQANVR